MVRLLLRNPSEFYFILEKGGYGILSIIETLTLTVCVKHDASHTVNVNVANQEMIPDQSIRKNRMYSSDPVYRR